MTLRLTRRSGIALFAVVALLLSGALVLVAQSSASNIYACVKQSGAARISKSKLKCRAGEKKLTWNTSGRAGVRGTVGAPGAGGAEGKEGKEGKEGAAGLAQGFGATQTSSLSLLKVTSLTTVTGLSKALPAGSFIASANVEIDAKFTGVAGQTAGVSCELLDTGAASTGKGRWQAAGVAVASEASGEVSLHLPITNASASTLSLQCKETSETGTETLSAVNGALVAVQTSKNS